MIQTMRIFFVLLLMVFSMESSGQAAIARLKFEDAEEAFNKGDYATTLSKLEDAEKLFGKINVPILHLRIVSQDKLLQKKLDFNMLASLRKNCEQFLIDYETMEGIEEKYRQVYKIQEAYAKYPKTQEEYQKLVAEKNAEEEARRELARRKAPVKVYLFRSTGFAASAVGFQVFQDGQLVGRISNKEYITLEVLPGKHSFAAQDGRSTEIKKRTELTEIEILPETACFLEVDYNKWNGDLDVVEISREKAKEYFEKLKPISAATSASNQVTAVNNAASMISRELSLAKTNQLSRLAVASVTSGGAYLGITARPASRNTLLITAITPGSPAGKTELQVGDIIASINDQTPSESNTLQQIIGRYKPGTEITITVFRNGSPLEYKVTLEAAPGR